MHAIPAIFLCVLATFGLYALLSRVAVMLLPRGSLFLALDGRGKSEEEILDRVKRATLLFEREGWLSRTVMVILDPSEKEKKATLRKEGVLVYTVID